MKHDAAHLTISLKQASIFIHPHNSMHGIQTIMTSTRVGCQKSPIGPIIAGYLPENFFFKFKNLKKHTCATVHKCRNVSSDHEIVLNLKIQQINK